jgi:hypothetical protein
MTLHPQYITNSSGQKHAVVLPIKEYNLLLNKLEELEDIHLYDVVKAKNESSTTLEQYLKKRKTKK